MPTNAEFRARLDAIRARAAAIGLSPSAERALYPTLDLGDVVLTRDGGVSLKDLANRAGQQVLSGRLGLAAHSHAAICISPYEIIEATPEAGLSASPLAAWLSCIDQTTATVWKPPASIDRKALVERIRYPYGRTYNFKFADWMPSSGAKAFYCSEYIAYIYGHFLPGHFIAKRYFPGDLPAVLKSAGFTEMTMADVPQRRWDDVTTAILGTATANYSKMATMLADARQALGQAKAVEQISGFMQQGVAEADGPIRPQALDIARFIASDQRRQIAPQLPVRFEQVDDMWPQSQEAATALRVVRGRLIAEAGRHRALVHALGDAIAQRAGERGEEAPAEYVEVLLACLPVYEGWADFAGGLQPSAGAYAIALAAEVAYLDAVPVGLRPQWMPVVAPLLHGIERSIAAYAPLLGSLARLDQHLADTTADDTAIIDAFKSEAMLLAASMTVEQLFEAFAGLGQALAAGEARIGASEPDEGGST